MPSIPHKTAYPIHHNIHTLLVNHKKTIAVAESCTGGLICSLLTEKPGSSQYFLLGIVAYSNQAKQDILRIPSAIIKKHGVVSNTTVDLMAKSVRRIARSDYGIGISGIAGPAGATEGKPKGTVFIAVTDGRNSVSRRFLFRGGRKTIRKKSALKALQLLYSLITKYL